MTTSLGATLAEGRRGLSPVPSSQGASARAPLTWHPDLMGEGSRRGRVEACAGDGAGALRPFRVAGVVATTLGPVEVAVDVRDRLVALRFVDGDHAGHPGARWPDDLAGDCEPAVARRIAEQLDEYFGGARRAFDLPLVPATSPFAQAVRRSIVAIPYGETRTYASIAREVGRPSAARAVGRVSARNPVPVVVPCHRLVGADGALRGYAGGLHLKRWLIDHEANVLGGATNDAGVGMRPDRASRDAGRASGP